MANTIQAEQENSAENLATIKKARECTSVQRQQSSTYTEQKQTWTQDDANVEVACDKHGHFFQHVDRW